MKAKLLVIALLVMPSLAHAGPITTGSWSFVSAIDPADNDLAPFWDGLSWDGEYLGVGYLLDANTTPELEFLHDGSGNPVSFRFDDSGIAWTLLYSITAWTEGVFGQTADGAFTYFTGNWFTYDSVNNPEQFVLFRIVDPDETRYFLGIEDIPVSYSPNDQDHNDYVVGFAQPVPEPSTLLLLGAGAAGLLGRRARHVRRSQA